MEKSQNIVVRILSQNIMINWLEPYKNLNDKSSIGSGFFISEDLILTCSHVVINSEKIFFEIPFNGKEKFQAKIVFVCPEFDIALIKSTNYKNKYFFKMMNCNDIYKLKSGIKVHAIGFPLGQNNIKKSNGIISGRNNGLIQTTAALNPGNSGGPLLYNNKVIGINISKISSASNVGYASPISNYHIIKNQKQKLILRPKLGIEFQYCNEDYINYNNLHIKSGIIIKSIYKYSLLSKLGIKNSDILLKINKFDIDNNGLINLRWFNEKISLIEYLDRLKLNEKINLEYYDGSKVKKKIFNFNLYPMSISEKFHLYDNFDKKHQIFGGIIVSELCNNILELLYKLFKKTNSSTILNNYINIYSKKFDNEPILIVTNIFPNSEVKNLDILSIGSVIQEVNDIKVKKIEDYRKALQKPLIKDRKKYFKIKTKNNIVIIELNKLLKDENIFQRLYKYPLLNINVNKKKTVKKLVKKVNFIKSKKKN